MKEILEILEKDARTTPEEIARMLKKSVGVIKRRLRNTKRKAL